MATSTMHFGPEWMRAKPHTPARSQPPPSPPPTASNNQQTNASTYSALVAPAPQGTDKHDDARPFRYSKEEMLRIYREGGGRGGLGLEVERWEGIVHEPGSEPTALREMDDAEKKLFAGPLNSEIRRRQSTDLINTMSPPSDRPRLNHTNTGGASPMRERFGSLMRRRESTDQPPSSLPRKLSLSNTQGPLSASRESALPSPRTRVGGGFDGVLNGGDSWVARRRASEGVLRSGGGVPRDGEPKGPEIKEEEEDSGFGRGGARGTDLFNGLPPSGSPILDTLPPDEIPDASRQTAPPDSNSLNNGVAAISLNGDGDTMNTAPVTAFHPVSGPPPGLSDPASVEWSYLDPQGQVQGPFRADLMQKWFDEGYFTPDLLMKRTHLETDWIPVGELERRAGGGKIFLSQPPASTGPPGLAHLQPFGHPHEQTFNGYQPVPTRTLRTTTLDSYLSSTSNPSDSPASSFGGGRFGNGSPDASVFAGRTNPYLGDPNFGGRGFNGGRVPFNEPAHDSRATFNGLAPGRTSSIDNLGSYTTSGSPWPISSGLSGQPSQGFDSMGAGRMVEPFSPGFNGMGTGHIGSASGLVYNQEPFGEGSPGFSNVNHGGMVIVGDQHEPLSRPVDDRIGVNGLGFNNLANELGGTSFGASGPSQFSQSPSLPFNTTQQQPPVSPFGEVSNQVSVSPDIVHNQPDNLHPPNPSSPWASGDHSTIRAARNRDSPQPVAVDAETKPPITPAQPQPQPQPQPANWGRGSQTSHKTKDPSPWLTASIGVVDDGWREAPGPNSLTFSNVGQHNQMQQEEASVSDLATLSVPPTPVESAPASALVPSVPPPSVPPAVNELPPPAPKARRKSTTKEVQAQAAASKPPPPVPIAVAVKSPSPAPATPATQSKPAWSTEEDTKKAKPLGTAMSLREIQEAEVKRAEARKAAEKERERLARANATVATASGEDAQPFTASWGLPTSQAGARNAVSPKDPPAGSTLTASSTPVWTNATPAPAAKKTMKEIQEEEERRKKFAVKETVAAAAARRAYAETTTKATPSAQTGGAWTTVGVNGKAPTPAVAPVRPTITPSTSAAAVASSSPVSRPTGTATRVVPSTVKAPAPSRVDDFPVTPSHDFLKWLSDSLKGLNTSVNLEEISSMLLSFPMDPDPSTVEIISDLIYANSTTLDGRRFAAEFVSKRRADAVARKGAPGPGTSGKPVSIADVVKTQPKPAQPEWGFKVVNKKKKGGRT
ncbi:hypothetical protein BV22DRAFT_1057157 [Leucogyrophana mollusca]|uniref:Uncharacterized protein n=1 Tax=Leucogyrophana mollusca TaxID=85980 RepID=A0ACB8BVA4_9AGAM|nr:hypothetical protein BV22DRAFT_1057157 [Leucogyrophana mollusca]